MIISTGEQVEMNAITYKFEENKENTLKPSYSQRLPINDSLSMESLFVAFVFFVVLSQFILYGRFEAISQPLRPLIVVILAVQVVRRGMLRLPVCNVALIMSIYQILVWFFLYPEGGSLMKYLVLVFYFMMLFSVAGFPWNRGELNLILYITFIATIICAVVFIFSNNMTDFSAHDMQFMGTHVNRNKNAYTFAFGFVLSQFYMKHGDGRSKLFILLIMLLEGYCLIYSQCRGAFLGVLFSFLTVAVHNMVRMKRDGNPYLFFYILTIIAVCVIVYYLISNSAVNRLIDSNNLSGRDESIEHAILLFRKAPLLGKIFGNGLLYEGANTEGIGVHFVYLTYLLEAGIIGALLIVLIFLHSARIIHGEVQWSLFILAFSRTFFEGMDYYIFIPLILSICLSNYEWLYKRTCKELFCRRHYYPVDNDYQKFSL